MFLEELFAICLQCCPSSDVALRICARGNYFNTEPSSQNKWDFFWFGPFGRESCMFPGVGGPQLTFSSAMTVSQSTS